MSRKSIIVLSTAMLLATTATGAFAGGGRSGSAPTIASAASHGGAGHVVTPQLKGDKGDAAMVSATTMQLWKSTIEQNKE